jgi:hypothetical protein
MKEISHGRLQVFKTAKNAAVRLPAGYHSSVFLLKFLRTEERATGIDFSVSGD